MQLSTLIFLSISLSSSILAQDTSSDADLYFVQCLGKQEVVDCIGDTTRNSDACQHGTATLDCSCVVYRAEVSCAKSHCTGIVDPTTGLAEQCGTGGDSKPAPATSSKAGKAAAGSTSSPAPTSSSSSVSSAGGKDEIKTATTSDATAGAGAVTGTSTSSSAASTGTEKPNFAGKTGVEMGLVGLGLGIGLGFFVGL